MNPPNFLLLDEPTTHLDIAGREALEEALKTYTGTFCLVSHDVDFVRKAATHIIAINHGDVVRYSGGYDYYRQKKDTQQPSKAKNEQAEKSKPSKNKELRVARARRREKEKPLRDLEKQIADLEEKLLKISDQMASPDANQAALSTEYATIEKKKQACEDQWIAEAEKLET
jgi:ATP-binding cassette subfamily F protein 3